jgi:hypothetical protein
MNFTFTLAQRKEAYQLMLRTYGSVAEFPPLPWVVDLFFNKLQFVTTYKAASILKAEINNTPYYQMELR